MLTGEEAFVRVRLVETMQSLGETTWVVVECWILHVVKDLLLQSLWAWYQVLMPSETALPNNSCRVSED
jgi:hypothetical protein